MRKLIGRKLIGGAVLVGGVIVLGLYASARPAHRIEAVVRAQAEAALQGAVHGAEAHVSGRDITLTGLLDGEAEAARVMAALEAVPGRRVLRSEAEVLPVVSPFVLSGTKGPEGIGWSGHLPGEAAREALAGAIGGEAAGALPLAAGAPDEEWGEVALAAARSLAPLEAGEVVLEDRAVRLTGVARTLKEAQAAQAPLTALPEGYRVEAAIEALDDGKPFALDIRAERGNATWQAGKLPAAMEPLDLDTAYGAPVAGNIAVARIGAEEGAWVSAAEAGMAALAELMEGRLRIEGHTLALTGMAATPAEAAAARAALEGLPEGFSPLVELELHDDGQPYALSLSKLPGGIAASGKLPAAMAGADLAALAGGAITGEIAVARIGAEEEGFSAAAEAVLRAVAPLKAAQVELGPEALSFTGLAPGPAEEAEARAALEALPGEIAREVRIEIEDDGRPLVLTVTKSAEGAWAASGKVPAVLGEFDYAAAAGVEALEAGGIEVARIGNDMHAFADAVPPGLAALAALTSGELVVREGTVALTGEADDPEAGAEAEAALAALPGGYAAETVLTTADDGTPPAFTFSYSVAEGGVLEGKLPAGMTPPEIAGLVGLERLEGAPDQSRTSEAGAEAMTRALEAFAPWMAELESLALSLGPDGGVSAELVASPGVDGELLQDRLEEALGGGVAVRVAVTVAAADAPDGTTRENPAYGGTQRLSGGVWLPVLDFEPGLAGCEAATAEALEGERIGFVTGSFRLDADSVRAVNGIAAVALPCAEAGLRLELGGHTDASGNAESNRALSLRRAEVVAEALAARGVPEAALTPRGYGADMPVADNETPEGRARNRRTTLRWSE